MKVPVPASLFELIDSDQFRNRAPIYFGEYSISRLGVFMTGYTVCEMHNGITPKKVTPPFWLFYEWIRRYYNHSRSYDNWDGIILQNCENDEAKALEVFFERFDEFRKFTPLRVLTHPIGPNHLEFFSSKSARRSKITDGQSIPNGPADHLFVIEYDNRLGSSLYHRKEDQHLASYHFNSTSRAIKNAEGEYGELLHWQEVPESEVMRVYEQINSSN